MLKKSLLLITLIVFTYSLKAQSSDNNPEQIINAFFDKYENNSIDEALEYIFSSNPWMQDSKTQSDALGVKLKNLISILGDYYSRKLITKASIANDLVMYSYLVKYDRQPLRFVLTFYKPKDKWRLHNFKYDDALDEELDEAIKAYRLKENFDY